MSISKAFGKILQDIRLENSLTFERMAGRCELEAKYYRELEQGKHVPKLDTALRLAILFDFSLDAMKEDL